MPARHDSGHEMMSSGRDILCGLGDQGSPEGMRRLERSELLWL